MFKLLKNADMSRYVLEQKHIQQKLILDQSNKNVLCLKMKIDRMEREINTLTFAMEVQSQRIQVQDLERNNFSQMLLKHAPLLLRQIESDVLMATEKLQIRIKSEISKKILMNMKLTKEVKIIEKESVATITQLRGVDLNIQALKRGHRDDFDVNKIRVMTEQAT